KGGLGGLYLALIRSVKVQDGDLLVELYDAERITLEGQLPSVVSRLIDAMDQLERPKDIPNRLVVNLRTDPERGVRLRNLSVLADRYHTHASTHEALRLACEDPAAEVRLAAALALGYEGRATLVALACGERVEDVHRVAAINAL